MKRIKKLIRDWRRIAAQRKTDTQFLKLQCTAGELLSCAQELEDALDEINFTKKVRRKK